MSENFLDVIAPLQCITKLYGYWLFTINRVNFKIKLTNVDKVLQISTVVVHLILNFYLWTDGQISLHKSGIVSKSLPIIFFCNYVLFVVCITVANFSRKKFTTIVRKICEIDVELAYYNLTFNYRKQKRMLIILCVIITITDLMLVLQCYIANVIKSLSTSFGWNGFSYFCYIQAYSCFMFHFVVMMYSVKQRFAKINEHLRYEMNYFVSIKLMHSKLQ